MAPTSNLQKAKELVKTATDLLQKAKEVAQTAGELAQTASELAQTLAAEEGLEYQHSTESRLLNLAPELRNRIYYYAALNAVEDHATLYTRGAPGLLAVCRQIRREFSSLYYSDAIMTMERIPWRVAEVWEPEKDMSVVRALFLKERDRRITGMAGGRAILGVTLKAIPGASGDVQHARRIAYEKKYSAFFPEETSHHIVIGILVFTGASGARSRAIIA